MPLEPRHKYYSLFENTKLIVLYRHRLVCNKDLYGTLCSFRDSGDRRIGGNLTLVGGIDNVMLYFNSILFVIFAV